MQFRSYQSKHAAASARSKAAAEKKHGEILSQMSELKISVEMPLWEVSDAAIDQVRSTPVRPRNRLAPTIRQSADGR
jgi:hypothetical protein